MKIIDRLYIYLANQDIKPTNFEKEVGLSSGYLSVQKKRNADIGESQLIKIIDNCHFLSIEWLLTGNGEMLISKAIQDKIDYPLSNENIENIEAPPIQYKLPIDGIPLIPVSAMAGAFNGDIQVLEHECERYIVPMFKDADFLISVKGSSMIPKYNSGDIIACKKLPLDTFFQWNKVYVVDTDQGALVKRIKKCKDPDKLLIVSDNPNYEPFELERQKIYHIALVVGVIRLE